jgi:hypothetical protein
MSQWRNCKRPGFLLLFNQHLSQWIRILGLKDDSKFNNANYKIHKLPTADVDRESTFVGGVKEQAN